MSNVERCDKTLPLSEMTFYVRRDARLGLPPVLDGRRLETSRPGGPRPFWVDEELA